MYILVIIMLARAGFAPMSMMTTAPFTNKSDCENKGKEISAEIINFEPRFYDSKIICKKLNDASQQRVNYVITNE